MCVCETVCMGVRVKVCVNKCVCVSTKLIELSKIIIIIIVIIIIIILVRIILNYDLNSYFIFKFLTFLLLSLLFSTKFSFARHKSRIELFSTF